MKINFAPKQRLVRFDELEVGDTFYNEATKDHLMLVQYEDSSHYVLNLASGIFYRDVVYQGRTYLKTNIEATVNAA